MIDFAKARTFFGGHLSQAQVDTLNAIDAAWAKYGDGDLRKYAYCLATTRHECGDSLEPVTENLTYTSASRIMQVWPSRFPTLASAQPYVKNAQKLANKVYGGRLGNDLANDGWTYRGRGFAQITGKDLYARVGKLIGEDLVTTPDLAKRPEYAAKILVSGLMKGFFTGKRLGQYINDAGADYAGARACVNADVAANGAKIAKMAVQFLPALSKSAAPNLGPIIPPHPSAPIPTHEAFPQPDVEPIDVVPVKHGKCGLIIAGIVVALVIVAILMFTPILKG